jgi:hypothetical protein
MNIITPDNFEITKKDILALAVKSVNVCNMVVTKIMDKACTEMKYTKLYAKLCDYMIKEKSLEEKPAESSEEEK